MRPSKLFQEQVYIRPFPGTTWWEVVKQTPVQAFWHDLFWYGLFVAVWNFGIEITS